MSKGLLLAIAVVISFIYYLMGQPLGGGPSDEPVPAGVCAGITDEASFTNCMENQSDGGDFPAP
jgi:hypothetical protein